MFTITALIQRHKHPLTWLYATLFYLNLFVGLWLHNWLIICTSIVGVLAVTLFQPATQTAPAWAERLIAKVITQWEAMPLWLRIIVLIGTLGLMVLLFYALWQNSIWATVVILIAIFSMKGYFLLGPISR